MFVSIDMDKLVFLHKHADHDTLSALAWLEAPNRSVTIESTEREHFLNKMGRLDLCILYKNTTGASLVSQQNNVLRQQLREMVERTKETPAKLDEVQAQIAKVEDDLHAGTAYKYARGAKTPAQGGELFPLVAKPLTDAQLLTAAERAPQELTHADAVPAPPPPAPRAPAVRAAGVRPVIWAHADAGWEAAGKPTDKTVVMGLRKGWMKELEEQRGIKTATASNELGAWMKDRLA
jgi:hypothetical protein